MKQKNVLVYVSIILLLIISWLVDGVRGVFADSCNSDPSSADYCGNQYKIYIPGISNISMGVTDVTGMLVTTRTMLPRPGLIVRMAEVICDDTPQLTEQHAHVGALKHPGMYEQSVRDGLVCVFVLDKEHSPGAITDDKGIFYVEDIPYRKYGYVPMVMEGDPEFFPVYVFLDDDGNTLVLDLVGGLLDIGTFQTDL